MTLCQSMKKDTHFLKYLLNRKQSGHETWSVKEEMYNTMNSYYKYTSIPKSSFYKINILILPINTGEKSLKYSIHFASICDCQLL